MKLISIIFLVIYSFINFQIENYYIIKIKGEIYNENSASILKQGDAIKASDELKFTQKDAMALVISDARGRFTLKFPERVEELSGALTVFVKNALISNQQNQLSTRSLGTSNSVNNLNDFLGRDVFNVIGDKIEIKLSKKTYPIYKGFDIIARYYLNDKEYAKELSTKNQTLVLSRKIFELPNNEEIVLEDLDVYLINISADKEEAITSINLKFIDKVELEKEFLTIINKFNDGHNSNSKIRSIMVKYFYEFYGKTDDFYLNQYTYDLVLKNTQK